MSRFVAIAAAFVLSIGAVEGQGCAKKGVTCPVDLDDVAALGAAQTAINIQPTHAFLPANAPDPAPEFLLEVYGVRLRFDPRWDVVVDAEASQGDFFLACAARRIERRATWLIRTPSLLRQLLHQRRHLRCHRPLTSWLTDPYLDLGSSSTSPATVSGPRSS